MPFSLYLIPEVCYNATQLPDRNESCNQVLLTEVTQTT
jgi:hypothetical protein